MSDEQLMEDVFDIICDTDKQTKIDAKFLFNDDTYRRLLLIRDSDGMGYLKTHMPENISKLCGFSFEIDNTYDDGEIKLVPANTIILDIDDRIFHNA